MAPASFADPSAQAEPTLVLHLGSLLRRAQVNRMRPAPPYSLLLTGSGPSSPTTTYFPLRYIHPPRSCRSNLIIGLTCMTLVSLWTLATILVFDPPRSLDNLHPSWWPEASSVPASVDQAEMLKMMVEQTDGYYTRDWSLWLGWNNIRYILETSILQASLLNRTLIVPSHVYMRSCEYPQAACAAFAPQVNRGDAVGIDEWRGLPQEEQQAWVLPIERMVDIDRLRGAGWSVVTGVEFNSLEGLDQWEMGNGTFPRELPFPKDINAHAPLTIYHIPNEAYEPNNTIRIDQPLPPSPIPPKGSFPIIQQTLAALQPLLESLRSGLPVAWREAAAYVKRDLGYGIEDDDVEMAIRWAGFARIWSLGLLWDMTKTVSTPSSHLIDPSAAQSWTMQFAGLEERIVHLEGEMHMGHPPGGLYFTTAQAANDYATMVVSDVRHVREVELLGERLAEKMYERVGGRMWSAAHMRRGDFIRYVWATGQSLRSHLLRVVYEMDHGRELLSRIQLETPPRRPRIAGFPLDETIWAREPPALDDPYYVATDERKASSLTLIHENRGVVLADLLTELDREELVGWPLLFTDVLSQVEQEMMARAPYFFGSRMSSVSGGVLNMRVAHGRDPRTGFVG
ncbi:hypothetical protein DACRYDRAFT_102540 [Dacryopinax primogenitus]|uniref:Uncharacterized protein n=1 Tax=Dacryopinax primogenitus (strain DJM 731) TaxID=1858805 RepID=M5G037_DACPD|nr:uncharacterized protein DACRYDRAFT_102540 [Dacryopinax primogenitus]EJT97137.1 hypothetical protein DACRYDRAFT_102540 [Dacryopinax primogenitus]